MNQSPSLVSIIINNFNYEAYLKQAIKSAIDQTYPNKEVIVVDDGSQDNSRRIINNFKDYIVPIYQRNLGQNAALNAGFKKSKGSLILFLDSDDYLKPDCLELCVLAAKEKQFVKVQYYLQKINEQGMPLRGFEPCFPLGNWKTIERDFSLFGYYSCPPMSGNLYCRTFVSQHFPFPTFDEQKGSFYCAADAFLCSTAAFTPRKIISVNKVLGFYRVHSKNKSSGNTPITLRQLHRLLIRSKIKDDYLFSWANRNGFFIHKDLSIYNLPIWKQRAFSYRINKKDHPILTDNFLSLLIAGVFSSCIYPYIPFWKRPFAIIGVFFIMVFPKFFLSFFSSFILKRRLLFK